MSVLRNPLHPFPRFPHPAGQAFTPLDVKAEAVSVETVEDLFAEKPKLRTLVAGFGVLLGDAERGRLAIKKALNNVFEGRLRTLALRADSPENHGIGHVSLPAGSHPVDLWIAAKLEIAVAASNPTDRYWHLAELFSLAIAVVVRAALIGFQFGRFSVTPRRCRLLVLNAWPEARWLTIFGAFRDHADFKDGDLVAEVNLTGSRDFEIIPTVNPAELPVLLSSWFREAVWGSALMAFRAVVVGTIGSKDARVVEAAIQTLRVTNHLLDARRLTRAVSYDVCVDNVEYGTRHILVAALGHGYMARWPHSAAMDNSGVMMSYLGYDLYLDGGEHQYQSHRHTWLHSARCVAVGMLQNDQHFIGTANVREDLRQAIEARVNRGQRMVILFGPSDLAPLWPPFRELALTAIKYISRRDDCFLVVKPKFNNVLYTHVPELDACENVVSICYDPSGEEICPTGYLIKKSDLTLVLAGSPIFESLTQGRACFAAYPAIQETPLRKMLVSCGVLYENPQDLGKAMKRYLDDPHSFQIPFDWFRENLDPFADDRALERTVNALVQHAND